ncbi:MAG: DUF2236 domain-containing protein, partial [Actinomycetota bacterium]|nr:DUF2236 domain-containing protein [Actinomycetota bacterium]
FMHTLDAALFLVFGSQSQARQAIARVDAVHGRVRGVLREAVGSYERGTPYNARDPHLLLWVYGTTIDSELLTFERYLGRLRADEQERYFQDTAPSIVALGVPEEQMPATLAGLRAWLQEALESDVAIGGFQRELAYSVLHPQLRFVPKWVSKPFASITLGLLPEKVREAYGFPYGPVERVLYLASPPLVRLALKLMPRRLRYLPLNRARRLGIEVGDA